MNNPEVPPSTSAPGSGCAQVAADRSRSRQFHQVKEAKKNEEINTIWESQSNQAGTARRFWNAPGGVRSRVEDGNKTALQRGKESTDKT